MYAHRLRRAAQIQSAAQIRVQAAHILRFPLLIQPRKAFNRRVAEIFRAKTLRLKRRFRRAQKRRFAVSLHVIQRASGRKRSARFQRNARFGQASARGSGQRKRPAHPRAKPVFPQNPLDFHAPRFALRLVKEQRGLSVFHVTRKGLLFQKP